MKQFNTGSLKFKMVLYSTLCVASVGILSNLYLYAYLNRIIAEKVSAIDALYLDAIVQQLDARFMEMGNLGVICASNLDVSRAMRNSSMDSLAAKRECLRAQDALNETLHSISLYSYVNKLMAFNNDGLAVQAVAMEDGTIRDLSNLMASGAYARRGGAAPPFSEVTPSVTPYAGDCLAGLFPIFNPAAPTDMSYVYIELDLAGVTDVLEPYVKLNPIFAATGSGERIPPPSGSTDMLDGVDLSAAHGVLRVRGREYRIDARRLGTADISIYNCTDITGISLDDRKMAYTILVVLASVLLVSVCLLTILSNSITRPVQRLISRIKKISANDFSFDPEIERGNDEIGEIGKVVNEMSLSINNLLKESVEQSEQKRNIEIDLLQSQVNPHFIYNTLNSIHWMAVIQKNPGICNITRSLSNLLKNMAKGFAQKIPLEEELALLNDYVTIQSIRYMETFELVNRIDKAFYAYTIVKLTLQPLVENAIFHGIEPSGAYGAIVLDAYEEGAFLVITVEDNGVGMTPEEIAGVKLAAQKRARNSMNGIGITNVDDRLRLAYGPPCGISIESEKGRFTRVSVRILKEGIRDV